MKKKLMALLLILCMAGTVLSFLPAQKVAASTVTEFTDVTHETVNDTSYKSIYWAVDNGIVKGFNDGSFQPETICTREQFSIMLWRFAGEPSSNAGSVGKFTDAGAFSNGAKKAVAWAVEKGIVAGFSDGSFKPKDDITRAQVAVMLWRYADKPAVSGSSKFSDIGSFSSNVQKAIIWLEANKIASGYKDGTFQPDGGCQRQHMAIFLCRYEEKLNGNPIVVPDVIPAGEEPPADEPEEDDRFFILTEQWDSDSDATISFSYDGKGHLAKAVKKKGSTTETATVTYSSDGRSATVNGSFGGCTKAEFKFDAEGNTTEFIGYNGSQKIMHYTYSSTKDVRREWNDSGSFRFWGETTYDSEGRVTRECQYQEDGKTVEFAYNYKHEKNGNTEKQSMYDNDNNLISVMENEYDSSGNRVALKSYYVVDGKLTMDDNMTYTYDSKGNMLSAIGINPSTGVEYWKELHEYNSAGLETKSTLYQMGNLSSVTKTEYPGDKMIVSVYDQDNKLVYKETYEKMEVSEPYYYDPSTYPFFQSYY